MITASTLKNHSLKDLGRIADRVGVDQWKRMRKEDLVQAILRAAKQKSKASREKPANSRAAASESSAKLTRKLSPASSRTLKSSAKVKTAKRVKPRDPRIAERIRLVQEERALLRDLSTPARTGAKPANPAPPAAAVTKSKERTVSKGERDRIVLMVRDAYWLQACWELTRQSVQRAQAAMAEHWHTSRPVLRVLEVDAGTTSGASGRVVREISIHGGVTNWYIDVPHPTRSYRVEIGYLGSNGRYYCLARSNIVTTPNPGATDEADPHWNDVAENFEKIYALSGGYSDEHSGGDLQELFEERLRRPMNRATETGFGVGAERALKRERDFRFDVDAEMLVFGHTKPNAHVTVAGAPVKVRPDGSFAVRLSMPDKRQVLPLVARSSDGVEHRTIVLAVERNTKVMEPMVREGSDS